MREIVGGKVEEEEKGEGGVDKKTGQTRYAKKKKKKEKKQNE